MESDLELRRKQNNVLRMAVVTSFITTFMGSALNLSIPDLESQFQVSGAMVGWIVTAFTLSVAAFSVPMGKIADARGRRKVLIIGISFFAVLSLACAFSVNIWMMLVLRVLQGLAAAMIFSTNNAILISVFPGSERGRVLGLSTAAVYLGLSLGPVIGGILNTRVGWQSIFIVSCGVALVSLCLAIKGAPQRPIATYSVNFDTAGNILYIAMITAFLYGLTNLSISKYGWIIMCAGLAFAVAFVLVEKKSDDPVIRISMFTGDAAFTLSNLAALLNYGATFAISYLVSIYLQIVMGYTSQTAGFILICMPAVQALFSPAMGKLSDRVAPYKLASAGMALCVAGLGLFALIETDTPLWYVIMALIIEGFGFALFSSPNTNAIMSCVGKNDYSVANSILATMRTVGHSSSMAIVTIVVGINLGSLGLDEAGPKVLVDTMHKCFYVFVVLCIIGVFMSLKRRKQ
jgi:multidrug resistance protein